MDGKYNTGDEGAIELKKALRNSPPPQNPNMSEAEKKMKSKGQKR